MLKYVTRRFRDTYEKGCNILYTRKTWTCSDKDNLNGLEKYESHTTENNKKSGDSNEQAQNDFNTEKYQTTWVQAVKWSSAFIIGWYATQIAYFSCKRNCRNRIQNSFPWNKNNYNANYNILSKTPYVQPILSQQRNIHVFNVGHETQSQSTYEKQSKDEVDSPKSFEEASIHLEKIVGQIENKLGVSSLISGNVASGLSQLKSGAEHGNAAANFNLGLCHELGIGVEKNYEHAENYYGIAARKGHTNAMYNLGVFYIQGRPGVKADCNKARRFFLEAAQNGHAQAADALKMDPIGYLVMQQNIVNVSQKTISI